MRILIVTPEFPPDYGGGIVTYYRDLTDAYRTLGHEVCVLKGSAFLHTNQPQNQDEQINTLETSRFHTWMERLGSVGLFPGLQRFLAAAYAIHEQVDGGERFDLVEVVDWGMLFVPWVTEARCKLIVQMHGSTGQISNFEPRAGCELAAMIELLIEFHSLRLARNISTYSRANQHWWQQNLDRDVNYITPPLKVYPTTATNTNTGAGWIAAGRIQRWKGPQVVCKAWQLIPDAPECQWAGRDTIWGENGQSATKWLADQFPGTWGKSIKPIGQITPAQLSAKMFCAKGVVVASTWDVFNYVAAEAMATGKVVVISDGAGAADLVETGVNGFVFENGNFEQLAEIVQRVETMEQDELIAIGLNAKEMIKKHLDPIDVAKAKLQYFESASIEATTEDLLLGRIKNGGSMQTDSFLDSFSLNSILSYTRKRMTKKVFFR